MNHKITYTHSTGKSTVARTGTFALFSLLEELLSDEHVLDDSIVIEPDIVAPVVYIESEKVITRQEYSNEFQFQQLLKRTGRG